MILFCSFRCHFDLPTEMLDNKNMCIKKLCIVYENTRETKRFRHNTLFIFFGSMWMHEYACRWVLCRPHNSLELFTNKTEFWVLTSKQKYVVCRDIAHYELQLHAKRLHKHNDCIYVCSLSELKIEIKQYISKQQLLLIAACKYQFDQ